MTLCIASLRATAIFAPAGYVLQLCEVERHAFRQELDELQAVLCSGMPLSDSGRIFVENTLKAVTIRCAGATEVSLLACECSQYEGMHLLEGLVFSEFIGSACSNPWPTMVVTSLKNTAFHLFRYRLGDVVTVSREGCRCGLLTPRIRILGREDDAVRLPDGDKMLSSSIQSTVDALEGLTGGYQMVFHTGRKPAVAECVVEAWTSDETARTTAAETVRSAIGFRLAASQSRGVRSRMPMPVVIRFVGPGALAPGHPKYRRVLCAQ